MPRITVLMAVHNGERYLRKAIDSVLDQTFHDFEFLVINDGSTDATYHILESYGDNRLHVIENERNLGLTKSLNRGLRCARGEFIARHDADDVAWRDRLAHQLAYLEKNPTVAIVGTQARVIDESGRHLKVNDVEKGTTNLAIHWQLIFDSPFFHSTVMARTNVMREALGGYNENYITSQDFELWARLLPRYAGANLGRALQDFRVHDRSVSHNYLKNDISKVRSVFIRNIFLEVGNEAVASEFADLWLALTNPKQLQLSPSEAGRIPFLIMKIYQAFSLKNPEAKTNLEIARHCAQKLLMTAIYQANFSLKKALQTYSLAFYIHPKISRGLFLTALIKILLRQKLLN